MVEGRKSIKFQVTYEGVGLHDYVFGCDEVDAELKARQYFELPADTILTVTRMSENSHGHLGSGRKQLAKSAGFASTSAVETAVLTAA